MASASSYAPPLQCFGVVLRRVHVVEARAFRFEAADLVFVDPAESNLVEQIDGPQLPVRKLLSEKRRHAPSIDRVQRLKAPLPMRDDDVVLGKLIAKMSDEIDVQEHRIAGGHKGGVAAGCREP